MTQYQNRRIVLAHRPRGEVADEDLCLETAEVRELKEGEILIKVLWLSLDPYMRPRMNDVRPRAHRHGVDMAPRRGICGFHPPYIVLCACAIIQPMQIQL